MRKVAAALTVIFMMASCAEAEPESTATTESILACSTFQGVAGDYSQGLMTDREMRQKMKQVYDEANIASSDVRQNALIALRAATQGNEARFSDAVISLAESCNAAADAEGWAD